MRNIARECIFELLDEYDTAAPGDRGIIQDHVNRLFEELNIDIDMTFTEFVERLTR